ncbi:MAG: GTP cyclohydrolase II [Thermoplasmata archaeon]|nr:MAG: GTP cyclohydrolase II [Thermoplasmata archaeon]
MPLTKPEINELIEKDREHYCNGERVQLCVKIVAVANLPTLFGDFQIVAFYNNSDEREHIALISGDVCGKEEVPVRLHSECLTGDAIGSLRCDCREQLIAAMKNVASLDNGIVLYLRQEGRGIGLLNKVKAYQLQDFGYDTVEANEALGFKDDERDYMIAAHMLMALDVKSINLLTNNPDKVKDLKRHGIEVVGRIPILIEPNEYNEMYLKTKMEKLGHMLDDLFVDDLDQ